MKRRNQPRGAEAIHQPADARRAEGDQQAGREERQGGLQRRPAQLVLQVQRHDELEAEVAAEHRHPPRLARTSGPERRIPSRTSGWRVRVLDRDERRQQRRGRGERDDRLADAQPTSGARTTVRTSSSMPAVMVTAPGRSKAPRARDCGRVLAQQRGASSQDRSANGTGSRNVQRQPISVMRPPRTSPNEKPLAPTRGVDAERLVAGRALGERGRDEREARGRGERRRGALDEARGDEQRRVARQAAEQRRDEEHGERADQRAPAAQAGRPRGRRAAAGRRSRARSRSTTHCSCEVVRPRSSRMDGSAMPTIETSRPSRKRTPHRRTREVHSRRSHRRSVVEAMTSTIHAIA